MKSFAAIALGLLPALGLAAPNHIPHFRCGNEQHAPPESLDNAHARLASVPSVPFPVKRQAGNTTVVPTYFHVVSTKAKQKQTTQAMLSKQLQVMNQGYAGTGFSFELVDTDFTVNDEWATLDVEDAAVQDMKKKLRKGTYAELNVYFMTDLANGILGMCEFPTDEINPSTPSSYTFDGCMVHGGSMPNAPDFPGKFDEGFTAVHEIGHWFGLYHVFQGSSCRSNGDLIEDTPFQSSATSGCPTTKDSCPNSPGVDSIHNFMDYSDDRCYEGFTKGQIKRINDLWTELREGN